MFKPCAHLLTGLLSLTPVGSFDDLGLPKFEELQPARPAKPRPTLECSAEFDVVKPVGSEVLPDSTPEFITGALGDYVSHYLDLPTLAEYSGPVRGSMVVVQAYQKMMNDALDRDERALRKVGFVLSLYENLFGDEAHRKYARCIRDYAGRVLRLLPARSNYELRPETVRTILDPKER